MPFLIGGEGKVITAYEVNDPEQLINVSLHYAPEIRFRFTSTFVTEFLAKLIARYAGTNEKTITFGSGKRWLWANIRTRGLRPL